jgi:hypothetical protein
LGIGTNLIEFAAKKAYSEGYRALVGIIQSTNLPLWRSLKGMDIPMTTLREGPVSVITVDLQETILGRWRSADRDETDEHYDK